MTDAMTAYLAADAASRAYYPTMQAATDAYRALQIGEAEYLAVRAAYEALLVAFDAAYAAVQDEPEEIEAVETEDTQADLFA